MSEDNELAGIRTKRMQELQQMQKQQENHEETAAKQEMAINSVLNQVLDQHARARLNTIQVAKPEKGKQLESFIIQMATTGQIGGKMTESELVGILERINAQMPSKKTTVKFDRRRAALDSDSDDW